MRPIFYLFITTGKKVFDTKAFSEALGISRVSFGAAELMEEMLGNRIGAATVFGTLLDMDRDVQVVIDKEVAEEEYYGCSDGTTTCYMKIKTKDIIGKFLPYAKHKAVIAEV
jgi:Ala-tRNA(Pro) deacylase